MTTINSVNRLRRSADPARRAESAERLSLLTEFIVVIDESSLCVLALEMTQQTRRNILCKKCSSIISLSCMGKGTKDNYVCFATQYLTLFLQMSSFPLHGLKNKMGGRSPNEGQKQTFCYFYEEFFIRDGVKCNFSLHIFTQRKTISSTHEGFF